MAKDKQPSKQDKNLYPTPMDGVYRLLGIKQGLWPVWGAIPSALMFGLPAAYVGSRLLSGPIRGTLLALGKIMGRQNVDYERLDKASKVLGALALGIPAITPALASALVGNYLKFGSDDTSIPPISNKPLSQKELLDLLARRGKFVSPITVNGVQIGLNRFAPNPNTEQQQQELKLRLQEQKNIAKMLRTILKVKKQHRK